MRMASRRVCRFFCKLWESVRLQGLLCDQSDMPEGQFDREKFEELVLHIAWLKRDDAHFGRLKLAKALFYTDFAAYAEEGEAITWATYEHYENGPFPPVLYDVLEDLERRDLVELIGDKARGGELRVRPHRKPEARRVERYQLVSARLAADRVAEHPSWRVSDMSHEHPGWRVTNMRQRIPYRTVLISEHGPNERDLERADQVIREHQWA